MKPILISTDLTPISENATREGIALARDLGAEVVLAHAWEPEESSVMDATDDVPPEQRAAEAAPLQRRLDEVVGRYRATHGRISTRLVEGSPTDAICDLAAEIDARLVVAGTGVPRVLSLILGSVAAALVRSAPCPVVVVRAD